MAISSKSNDVNYFKELPFFNVSIEKPKKKRLKNIDLLAELPFYNQLNIIKTDQAFCGYAASYKVETVDKKDLIAQLEASKSSIEDLFNDLLNETKSFKYQITVKVLLKKYKPNGEIEFPPVYFNSSTKTVISHRYKLDQSFQDILYRIDAKITKIDKKTACNLNYDRIKFPVEEKDFEKIEVQNNICVNVFGYENQLVFPIYLSDQTFKSSIHLLLLIDDYKSHYVYIKDFNTFMFHKAKNKNKNGFVKVVYNALVVKMFS